MSPVSEMEFHEGARACLMALRRMEQMIAAASGSQTHDEYFAKRDRCVAEILDAAGMLPARAAGALTVMAEYLTDWLQNGCCSDLEAWTPEAAMSATEREAARKAFCDEIERDLGNDASKVVPFPVRGAAR